MSHDSHTPNTGLLSRLPRPSLRQRRVIAMSSAAILVVVGLGAFGLLPPVRHMQTASEPVMMAANESGEHAAPRMLDSSAPFSFADLVERVSPAVVTITSETTTTEGEGDAEHIPAPLRGLFH